MIRLPTIEEIILLVLLVTLVMGTLPTIYQLQVKEYLWFRLLSKFKDEGLKLIPWRMPARSIRNLVIWIFSTVLNIAIVIWIWISVPTSIVVFMIYVILATILSKVFVVLGMFISNPLANYMRNKKVIQARAKLNSMDSLKIIGITGSYGKSSVKEYMTHVLSEQFNTTSTIKNYNTTVGTAISVMQNINIDTEIFVAEMGAYRSGEIAEICHFVKPDISVITGLGNQHLDLFGSKEVLINTKLEIAKALDEDGVLYINKDVDNWAVVKGKLDGIGLSNVITYSLVDSTADVYGLDISTDGTGDTKFTCRYRDGEYTFTTSLVGIHNVLNLLPVIAIAIDGGMDVDTLSKGVSTLGMDMSKIQFKKLPNGTDVIDDSYNSNRDGFSSALKVLSDRPGDRYVLTRGILELGDEKEDVYMDILRTRRDIGASMLTTDPLFSKLDSGVLLFKNDVEMLKYLVDDLKSNSTILLEGRFSPKFLNKIYDVKTWQ